MRRSQRCLELGIPDAVVVVIPAHLQRGWLVLPIGARGRVQFEHGLGVSHRRDNLERSSGWIVLRDLDRARRRRGQETRIPHFEPDALRPRRRVRMAGRLRREKPGVPVAVILPVPAEFESSGILTVRAAGGIDQDFDVSGDGRSHFERCRRRSASVIRRRVSGFVIGAPDGKGKEKQGDGGS